MNAYCLRCGQYTHRCGCVSHIQGASFPGIRRAAFLPAKAPAPISTQPGLLRRMVRALWPFAK